MVLGGSLHRRYTRADETEGRRLGGMVSEKIGAWIAIPYHLRSFAQYLRGPDMNFRAVEIFSPSPSRQQRFSEVAFRLTSDEIIFSCDTRLSQTEL